MFIAVENQHEFPCELEGNVGTGNDNRMKPIPAPEGGFVTNEAEAAWLEKTLIMRFTETIRANLGINAEIKMRGLGELLLISLDAATKRGMPKQTPCAWCGKSRAEQVNVCFSDDDETPLCESCWTQEYGGPDDLLRWTSTAPRD